MPISVSQLWNHPSIRSELIYALCLWNSALRSGLQDDETRAVQRLQKTFQAGDETVVNEGIAAAQTVERLLNSPSQRLAVYGSLAPGKQNHHMMDGMTGKWRKALLRGSLHNAGWGAGQGFPGFVWDGMETAIAAQVFSSADLPAHWARLDEFEGEEYRRILVPAEIEGEGMEVCNVYELGR